MAVYVDPVQKSKRTDRWAYDTMSHLVADTLEELHAFAKRIGLRQEWFQEHEKLPHYDITENMRALAVRRGAIEVDHRFLVKLMKKRELKK